MKTAKTIALIILIINALYLLYCIYYFSTGGWAETMKVYQEAMEQVQQNQ